jgi:acyl-CoA synthetase (AMP-forming)/AMP-acid ligase II
MSVRADLEYQSVPGLLARAAERFADAEAIADDGVRITFAQLADLAEAATRSAIAAGIGRGDRAAIWAPNLYEWVVAAVGVQGAGAAIVPINTRYRGKEAAAIVRRSGARALFCVNGFLGTDYTELLASSGVELPGLEHTVVLRGAVPPGAIGWDEWLGLGSNVAPDEARARWAAVSPDDLSDIIFTSARPAARRA